MLLALIADDFTGALDTAIQFAKRGIKVAIHLATADRFEESHSEDVEVLVIDAETRHLDSRQAYEVTRMIAQKVKKAGADHLYVKTDSGLRGNIGSALKAVLDQSEDDFLAFLPAYPDTNRTTEGGIQYIDGAPIHESSYASDPFDPVTSPFVRDLFAGVNVRIAEIPISERYHIDFNGPMIAVFDAKTNEDLSRIAGFLRDENRLGIIAGCAGFAQVLPEVLRMPKRAVSVPNLKGPLCVVCGSLNPVARSQVEYAATIGFARIVLEPAQELVEGYFDGEAGLSWLSSQAPIFRGGKNIVIDTGISQQDKMRAYLEQEGIDNGSARVRIANALGILARKLHEAGYLAGRTLMFIGGDTFLSAYQGLDCSEIVPVCELEKGTVLSSCVVRDETLWVISKSGGMGAPGILERITERRRAFCFEGESR